MGTLIHGFLALIIFTASAYLLHRWYLWGKKQAQEEALNPVGYPLATLVADQLEQGLIIAHGHAYYCGMGLRVQEGAFLYGEVHDGEFDDREWHRRHGTPTTERMEFTDRAAFIDWLAVQTDQSFNSKGNQRLSIKRLSSAVGYQQNHSIASPSES